MQQVQAAMMKPEYCNVLLLGEAGSGKTALVQGIMAKDTSRKYLEVDLSKMIANLKNENEMADRLKTLFDEVSRYRIDQDQEIVLFIDEFHQIVQLSPAAVEVLKPLLADSGTRGIRVIAATTHIEYQQFIAPNLPLVERLQRIKLVQPGEETVISILKNMCERYGVEPYRDTLYHSIYEYTNRYIPATSQPRKSILILDSMIGWHRLTGRPLDKKLLADVIYETEGINVAFRVNARTIKQELDKKVLAQEIATSSIEQRLQICVAGLNNPNRPMSSFLFTGSTGTGKTETTKQLANILFDDDRNLIRFDMTEYALDESLPRFRAELTKKVSILPYCIVLLDEIEKACAPVTRLLLQVLDDGRLLDENEREVTFKNAYIIITTNAGNEIYKTISNYGQSDKADFRMMEKYDKLIRESIKNQGGNKFPPELLGRIDCIVPFQPLSKKTMMGIVQMKLKALQKNVKMKHNVDLHVHKDIFIYLIYDKLDTDSDSGGARIVVSKLEREVIVPLSRYINDHPHE
jgi:ATP-dependent Clp protease ATP-binding subunit ClpA